MNAINFDARTVQPQTAMEPVPDGWYKAVIRKSNLKQTKAGDGGFLELIHEIIEGPKAGRTVYWNLNLYNPNEMTVKIAYQQLSAICHCIGQYQVQDQGVPDNVTPMLHNIPYFIWVTTPAGSNLTNVRGCKDINGNDPGKGQTPSAPAPAAQPGWGGTQGGTAPAPAWGGGAPAAAPAPAPGAAWGGPQQGPQGAGAPPGWSGQPATPSAPVTAAPGQPWQPGTNTPPAQANPAWQPNPAAAFQPTGAPAPATPQWQQGGAPTQQAQQPAPPNAGWQQGGAPASAPWATPSR